MKENCDQTENAVMVYAVTCYQNLVGIYKKIEDAQQAQMTFISKGRIADLIVKPLL